MARVAKAKAKTSEMKVTEVKADVTAVVRKARAPSPVVSSSCVRHRRIVKVRADIIEDILSHIVQVMPDTPVVTPEPTPSHSPRPSPAPHRVATPPVTPDWTPEPSVADLPVPTLRERRVSIDSDSEAEAESDALRPEVEARNTEQYDVRTPDRTPTTSPRAEVVEARTPSPSIKVSDKMRMA